MEKARQSQDSSSLLLFIFLVDAEAVQKNLPWLATTTPHSLPEAQGECKCQIAKANWRPMASQSGIQTDTHYTNQAAHNGCRNHSSLAVEGPNQCQELVKTRCFPIMAEEVINDVSLLTQMEISFAVRSSAEMRPPTS